MTAMNTDTKRRTGLFYKCQRCGAKKKAQSVELVSAPWCGDCCMPMAVES